MKPFSLPARSRLAACSVMMLALHALLPPVRGGEPTAIATWCPAPGTAETLARSPAPVGLPVVGEPELVAVFPDHWASGIAVLPDGRRFVSFPRFDPGPPPAATLAELRVDGTVVPYPDADLNRLDPARPPGERLVSVHALRIDAQHRLWALDSGILGSDPAWVPGGPKLVCFDLATGQVERTYPFPVKVVGPQSNLNDFRLDLTRGLAGIAFLTDSGGKGPGGIVVLDLATGRAWRRLAGDPRVRATGESPPVDGRPLTVTPAGGKGAPHPDDGGANGIALSADRSWLFWTSLTDHSVHRVPTALLADPGTADADVARAVETLPPRDFVSDGLETDARGRLLLSDLVHNAIRRRSADGEHYETLARDPRLIWPDSLHLAADGFLYFTCNQVPRRADYAGGQDQRQPPYALWRVWVGGNRGPTP